ncbi:hypothetical protein HDU81_008030 [Chytriomyces hyalinus]|nr:hypothetical protein HDU81_008030 [Chytriomyces hyalinus]
MKSLQTSRPEQASPIDADLQSQTDAYLEDDLESDLSSVDLNDLTSSDVEGVHDTEEMPASNAPSSVPLKPTQLYCEHAAKEKPPIINRSTLLPPLCSLGTPESRIEPQPLKKVSRFSSIQIILDSNSIETIVPSGKMDYVRDGSSADPDTKSPQDVQTPAKDSSACGDSNLQIPAAATNSDNYNTKLNDVIDEYLQDSGNVQDVEMVDELPIMKIPRTDLVARIGQPSLQPHEPGCLGLNAPPADLTALNPTNSRCSSSLAASVESSTEQNNIPQTDAAMQRNQHQIMSDTGVNTAEMDLSGTSERTLEKEQAFVHDALPNETSSEGERMDDMQINDSDGEDMQNEHTLVDEDMLQLLDDPDLQDCETKNGGKTAQPSAPLTSVARHHSINGRPRHKPNGLAQGDIPGSTASDTLLQDQSDKTQTPINCTTRPKYAIRRPGKRLTRAAASFLQQLLFRKPVRIEIPYKPKRLRKKVNWEKVPM